MQKLPSQKDLSAPGFLFARFLVVAFLRALFHKVNESFVLNIGNLLLYLSIRIVQYETVVMINNFT